MTATKLSNMAQKYATLLSVPLTTINQPCRDIAEIASRTMLQRIGEPALPITQTVTSA